MANLNYDDFTESVRAVLKLRNKQDDVIVKEIVEAAVRDVIEEFDSSIGSRIDYCLCIEQVDVGCDKMVSRIYLPDDAHWLVEAYVGDVLITPIDMTDKKFWSDYNAVSTRITGLEAFVGRTEGCGTMYIEFAKQICVEDTVEISVIYRLHSSDINYIPEAFKTLMLSAAISHYRNWYMLDNPAAVSKAEATYKKYLSRMRSEQANQVTNNKRPYEVEWKKLFRFILEGGQNDFYSVYTGSN